MFFVSYLIANATYKKSKSEVIASDFQIEIDKIPRKMRVIRKLGNHTLFLSWMTLPLYSREADELVKN